MNVARAAAPPTQREAMAQQQAMKRDARRPWKQRLRIGLAGLALAAVALNGLAFMHARAMTHFAPQGSRTPPPEQLSFAGKLRTLALGVTVPRPANTRSPADVGLPFETRLIVVDGSLTLEAWLVPHPDAAGATLLFHGYAASKEHLLEAARVFYDLGQTVILVDFRGSGGSGGDRTTLGYGEARDVAAAVRWAQGTTGDARPVLYGVSMGAAAALRAVAVEGVQPRALILEAPFDRLLTTIRHRFEAMRMPASPGAELLLFWGSVQAGFDGFGHNPVDYAPLVHRPTLIMHGAADPRVTAAEARAIYDRLPGPKRLEIFPGTGHTVGGAIPPELWQTVVARFLATLT